MKLRVLLTAACLSTLFSGCIMVDLPEVKRVQTVSYSLNISERRIAVDFPMTIGFFTSDVPVKFKMMVRDGTELCPVPLAKWTEPPAYLVGSALRQIFNIGSDDSSSNLPVLEGKILTFEKISDENQVVLQVEYRLLPGKQSKTSAALFVKTLETKVKAKDDSPTAYAEAMSEAVFTQAKTLAEELKKIRETNKK